MRKYLPGYQTDDPCQRVNYYYDTNPFESGFTQNGWGRLAVAEYGQPSCTGGQYRESYSYTSGGLPLKKKLWVYGGGLGVGSLVGEWSYDDEGKILTVKYPDTYDSQGNPLTGRTYTNGYDAMGRLATLVDNRPGTPPGYTWVQAATYNVAGQMTELRRDNTPIEQREYNERLQVTRINYPGLTDTHYYYPVNPLNDGRITQRNVNGVDTMYTYDSLGRLATAGSASYTYDGFGNRVQQTSPAMYLTYNASNNRITSTGYSYDDNGNLTTMPNLTMSYDVENRLAEAQTQNATERYRYAPSGQRVWKQKLVGTMEWYFYGVDGRLIGTYVRCSMVETLFQEQSTNVYFGGRTLQAQGQTGIKQDRLGTTNATNNYAPYGDTGINPPPYGDGMGFTGYYRDGTSTGLDYAQQRYYAPSIGRFTSPDPYKASAAIARPQSWNRYAYVENNPVNFTDPSGLYIQWCDGEACGGGGQGAGWGGGTFTGSPFDSGFVPGPPPLPGGGSYGDGGGGGTGTRITITTSGVTHSGVKQGIIDLAMVTLENVIDPDCRKWLEDGEVHDFAAFSCTLLKSGAVGHGTVTTTEPNSIANAVTNPTDAPGFAIVINDSGAFFSSGATTDNGKISGGTLKAEVFLLLHEYAHLNKVSGFENDAGDSNAGKRNNDRVEEHCSKTLKKRVLK